MEIFFLLFHSFALRSSLLYHTTYFLLIYVRFVSHFDSINESHLSRSFFIFRGSFCLYFIGPCTKYTNKIPIQRYHRKFVAVKQQQTDTMEKQRQKNILFFFCSVFPCSCIMKFGGVLRSINFYYTIYSLCIFSICFSCCRLLGSMIKLCR